MSDWSWWAVSITQPEREVVRVVRIMPATTCETTVDENARPYEEEIVCRARDEIEAFTYVKRWLEESK